MTIGQILKVWAPDVVDALRMPANEHIVFRSLAARVECDGETYPVEELVTSISWSKQYERRPEREQIALVKSLLESAVRSHQTLIVEKMGTGRAVISKEYYCMLGNVEFYPNTIQSAIHMYTAVAFIPETLRSIVRRIRRESYASLR